jgi:hypothetical protein
VSVKRSTLTAADIDAIRNNLIAFHAKHTNYFMSFWFDVAKDAMLVGGNVPPSLTAELRKAGKVIIETDPKSTGDNQIASDPPDTMHVQQGGDRWNDSGPWHNGGAGIHSSSGAFCTSGFSMDDNVGGTYSVTAGHCGKVYTTFNTDSTYYGDGSLKAPYPSNDMLKIQNECCDSYGDQIWTSPRTTRTVSNAYDGWPGMKRDSGICVSGAAQGGELCGASIISVTATFCPDEQCTRLLMAYEFPNGVAGTFPGDSGAPVYDLWNGTAEILGMHIGNAYVPAWGGWVHYAENYEAIKAAFGGGIRSW